MPLATTRDVPAALTANGALDAGSHNRVDASGAARTMTLPSSPNSGASLSVTKSDTSANAVTISGASGGNVVIAHQGGSAEFVAAAGVWHLVHRPLAEAAVTALVTSVAPEVARDAVAAALRAGTGISIASDDAADTITITATGGGGGSTDPEVVRDTIAAALRGGTGITVTSDDAADTITITATGAGGTTDAEVVRDTIAAALRAGTGITVTADDAADTITITLASHTHTAAQISDATTTGRSLLTAANAAAVRTTAGSPAAAAVEGVMAHDGSAGGGTRPSGFYRVRWLGGTSRPTNMVTGDVWERDV